MIRGLLTFTCFLGAFGTAGAASAQWKQALNSPREAGEFCRCSAPKTTDGPLDPEQARELEAYETERRSRAQRPVVVTLGASAAPVIGYDETTGTLGISLYRPAPFAKGYAVHVNIGAAEFELPLKTAQTLHARYEAGTASLRLTLLPLAWSDTDKALCRSEEDRKVVEGEVLEAELIDEVGQTLARMRTELGREVAMMREHRIRGYLDSAVPVVTVSSVTPFPDSSGTLAAADESRIKSALRSSLYGCYLRGLTKNARLQGALVVQMQLDESEAPRVLVDSLHSDETTACASARIAEFHKLYRPSQAPTSLKATVIFKLEEAPNL